MGQIPSITTEQMREVDRLMIEEYGIQLVQMMENAGRNLAALARAMAGSLAGRRILVACGKGHNGGGGLVAARHLANWGADVTVAIASPHQFAEVPAMQWQALRGLPLRRLEADAAVDAAAFETHAFVIDALLGYSLRGDPHGWIATMIECINALRAPVLSLDVPSGLDATTGRPATPCVRAAATMTLALAKAGLLVPEAKQFVGTLYLADIGVPSGLYERLGLRVGPLFAESELILLT